MSTHPSADIIIAIRDAAVARLGEVMAAGASKPTYSVDGQSVQWDAYAERLQRQIDWCIDMLQQIDAANNGPTEEETLII